jgi:hypothetical protein
MMAPPTSMGQDMEALLHAHADEPSPKFAGFDVPAAPPATVADLQEHIASQAQTIAEQPDHLPQPDEIPVLISAVLREMAGEEGCTFQSPAALFQDFTVRCRMRGIKAHGLDATAFRKRFSAAVVGLDDGEQDEQVEQILILSRSLPEDLVTPFLGIAKAAAASEPCPPDEDLAVLYGTSSLGRARRMLEYLERSGFIVVRTDFAGRRTVAIPQLNLVTLAA